MPQRTLRGLAVIAGVTLASTLASPAHTQIHRDAPDAPYDLGTPPRELGIEWPARPRITRTVLATTLSAANAAAARRGTRVQIARALRGTIRVRASDVELSFAPGAGASAIVVRRGVARVAVRGGRVEHVELELAADWDGDEMIYRPEHFPRDVLFDAMEVEADDTAFLLRAGVRVAVTNSRARAARYALWVGTSGPYESEDVIVAGNRFEVAGEEATMRLVHVVRSATIDNWLENDGTKHNYRVHGRSALNWASGNVLVDSGVMLGTMPEDDVGPQWFDDNTIHHTRPSLLEVSTASPSIALRRNTIYSDVWRCFLCRRTPRGWIVESNRMGRYRQPPAE